MAAEAFLLDTNGLVYQDRASIIKALKDGNTHASRFTQTEAEAFTGRHRGEPVLLNEQHRVARASL